MKTDYEWLGRRALECLEASVRDADDEQTSFLLDWLKENRDTRSGRRYGFSKIGSVREYQRQVPLSTYGDYAGDIERIIAGEKNILTARDAVYFCISSGTVGDEKYIPLTEYDLEAHYTFMYGAVFGQIREYYKDLPGSAIFGKIFQIGEFAKTCMPDGTMNGIRSSCIYQWLDRNGDFDASDHCVPKEILFPDTLEDRLYSKVRFALAERGLTAIHGVFINRVAGVIEYILHNWDLLLEDMEFGTVSVDLSQEQRRYLIEKLPPDPGRAKELRDIPRADLQKGIVKKIWKDIKYILAIGGDSFFYYTEKMRGYAEGVPVHYFVYAASEGVFGLAQEVGVPDRYILLPASVFFEFIPAEQAICADQTISAGQAICVDQTIPAGQAISAGQAVPADQICTPLLMGDVEVGKKYELVITNRSGLYRYRIGDVVKVVGMYGKAPVVRFCCRRDQVINLAGEKSDQQQFDMAIKRFSRLSGIQVRGYCVSACFSEIAPRYLFYMECRHAPRNADEIFEGCMCEANPGYKSCRNMHEIAPLHIEFLREGSFKRYEQMLARKGRSMAQSKMPRFLDTREKKDFFAAQVIHREERL